MVIGYWLFILNFNIQQGVAINHSIKMIIQAELINIINSDGDDVDDDTN